MVKGRCDTKSIPNGPWMVKQLGWRIINRYASSTVQAEGHAGASGWRARLGGAAQEGLCMWPLPTHILSAATARAGRRGRGASVCKRDDSAYLERGAS